LVKTRAYFPALFVNRVVRQSHNAFHKREDTENEGKGSHQDWTQSRAAGFDGRSEAVFAIAILNLPGLW
jgi:hypothetical protein